MLSEAMPEVTLAYHYAVIYNRSDKIGQTQNQISQYSG